MPTHRDPAETETRYVHEFLDVTNARVLEIGCGDGRLTWRYAESAAQVVGVDPDFERVQAAMNGCPSGLRERVSFMQAVAQALPFPRETFDRAILAWSL